MASQDMPPPGGFASINVDRTSPRPLLKQGVFLTVMIGLTINGIYYIREWRKKYRVLKIEQVEHYIAASPFLLAEQERKYLLHLRQIREEERELMKDHPGWKLGTLYGEPVFKTLPKGVLPPVNADDFMAHRPEAEWFNRVVVPDKHQ